MTQFGLFDHYKRLSGELEKLQLPDEMSKKSPRIEGTGQTDLTKRAF